MMFKWIPFAMVRIALVFIGGIVLAIHFPDAITSNALIAIGSLLLLLFFILEFSSRRNRFATIKGITGLSLVFIFGYLHLLFKTDSRNENHLLHVKDPVLYYEASIESGIETKSKTWKVELNVHAINTVNGWREVNGKVVAYIAKTAKGFPWKRGDRLLVKGAPGLLKGPANPGEFDYRRFLGFKNIYHQHYLLPENILRIAAGAHDLFYYSQQARDWASLKIHTYVHGEQNQAIALALVLGMTDEIEGNVLNAFAASGAMHVLAVSGMHVGIIYVIVLFLLRPLNQLRWGSAMVAIISLLLLWVFAFVTGLTPSVLRAVMMFSFIIIAKPFNRGTNIYNTMAASAFVLLLINPYLIMSVGFQLSYLAVLGILYLHPPIYKLWEIESRIGNWMWQITCVSLVAQVATLSLSLFYFHQFPVYFLLSNLLIIPLSTGVLLMGIVLLAVSFIPPLAHIAGQLTEWCVQLLNWVVFSTERLPYSLIENIHITSLQCWLLMGLVLTVFFVFQFRSIKWLYIACVASVLFSIIHWNHHLHTTRFKAWIVYAINGHSAMEWTDHKKSYFIADSALASNEDRIRFHIAPYRLMNDVTSVQAGSIPFQKKVKGISLFYWNNKTIAYIDKKPGNIPVASVDYVVIGHNAISSWKEFRRMRPGQIILDGSNSKGFTEKIKRLALADSISVYSVAGAGAFVMTN